MTDTPQPSGAGDPIQTAADAFLSFDPTAPKELPPRGPDGKFVSAAPEEEAQEIEAEETEAVEAEAAEAESQDEETAEEAAEEAQPDPLDLPTSWPSEMAETWKSLPPETQEFITRREGERDAAVNAKFQEAANLRKAHEAEINEAKTNRQAYREATDFLLSVVQPQKPPASMLDQSSSDYNPDAYHLALARYQEQAGLLNAVAQQRAQLAQQEETEQEQARQERIAEINSKHMPELVKLVPDFSNPEKANDAFMGLAKYALSQGVPEETELAAFTAVELALLAKAKKYDEMMAAKAKVTPKAPKPSAPVVKPGVATPRATIEAQKRKQALHRLDQEGSIEAGAAAFMALTRK